MSKNADNLKLNGEENDMWYGKQALNEQQAMLNLFLVP